VPLINHWAIFSIYRRFALISVKLPPAWMRAGRENASEKMCANLYSVTENMARAIRIYKRAVENNIGTWLDL
jgi:hypothetical protein